MKRTRIEDDFNPVYPYDAESTPAMPFISPPFVSGEGFQENPPGTLSLYIDRPLYFNAEKKLAISLGRGLEITSTGQLQNTNIIQASSPLSLTNNQLSLNYANPLRVVNDRLTFTYDNPFQFTNSNLSLKIGDLSGLRIHNGNLKIHAGWGVSIAHNNELTLRFVDPFTIIDQGPQNGRLSLKYSKGLAVQSGNLQVKLGNGLHFNNSGAIELAPSSQNTRSFSPNVHDVSTLHATPSDSNVCFTTPSETRYILNAKLSLKLTKIHSVVFGTLQFEGTGAPLTPLNSHTITSLIDFDNHLLSCNTQIVHIENGFLQHFYPSPQAYTQETCNSHVTAMGFINRRLCPLVISFNETKNQPSIRFTWNNLEPLLGQDLCSSVYSFNYYC